MKLRTKSIDECIKEFKGICDNIIAILKPLEKDSKVINFASGLGSKYTTLQTFILSKAPYPTFSQFVNTLRGLKMREDGDKQEAPTLIDLTMAFVTQKSQE